MTSEQKELPEVYIYMGESIDGKGSGEMFLVPESKLGVKYYFEQEYSFGCTSILMGRTTFQELIGDKAIDYTGITEENIIKKDYISDNVKKTKYYYISLDKNGKINWPTGYGLYGADFGRTEKTHIITVLSEDVELKYLAYLQKIGASYIFAGEKNIDLKVALKKLKNLFGIDKILCQGGPKTNELLLKENLVEKIILVKLPVIGQPGALPILGESPLSAWDLESFQLLSDKRTLVLVYKIDRNSQKK
jgi:dihydrofolate reductase